MFGKSMLLVICSLIGLGLVGAELPKPNGETVVSPDGQTANINCNAGYSVRVTQFISNNKVVVQVSCEKDCGVFAVIYGDDVPSGTPSGKTVNISCTTGMNSVPKTVTCSDGVWGASNAICLPACGVLPVANGKYVSAGASVEDTVNIRCDDGMVAPLTTATCSIPLTPATWSTPDVTCSPHTCILLIGGDVNIAEHAPVEYYHPSEGVECNEQIVGSMFNARITVETKRTSGCYIRALRQVIIREKGPSKPPMVYDLVDCSVVELPLPYRQNTYGSTAASVGRSKCISCGGHGGGYLNNCYQFDPFVDNSKWTKIASMPPSVAHPASVSLTQNDFYVIGGHNRTANFNQVYRYDVAVGNWTEETPMNQTRYFHAATALSTTKFIVCGGWSGRVLSSCEIYDTTLKAWRDTGSLNVARGGLAMVRFDGYVYAMGGRQNWMKNTVEKYNEETETWEMAKTLRLLRQAFVGLAV